jgi:hypothetical protein
MGARVRSAEHLGGLLGGKPRPRAAQADYQDLIDEAAEWQKDFFAKTIAYQAQAAVSHPI